MSWRVLLATVSLLALTLGGTSATLAQKTKTKGGPPQTTQQQQAPAASDLDPNDPDDLKEIVAEADAAYFVAEGQEPDFDYAFRMYTLAADGGDAYSMNRLALMYDRGESVRQDFAKAFDWYLKAAEAGLPAAQSNVGSMYDAGDGVEQDYDRALEWYTKAADNGYGFAMYAIGDLYLAGEGVRKDAKQAATWYQKAADNNEPNGFWALSLRYLYGDGVATDTAYAAELAYEALTRGLQVSLDELKTIDSADTPVSYRRKFQQLLKDDGFYSGSVDGNFGSGTVRAIESAFGSAL